MLIRDQDVSAEVLGLIDAAEQAVRKIAPLFPPARAVAVSPFNGLRDEPIALAAARLERNAGVRIFPCQAVQMDRLKNGQITVEDIQISRSKIAPSLDLSDQAILDTATTTDLKPQPIPTVADLAAEHSGTDWPALLTERIGAWAQGHFDTGDALWTRGEPTRCRRSRPSACAHGPHARTLGRRSQARTRTSRTKRPARQPTSMPGLSPSWCRKSQ